MGIFKSVGKIVSKLKAKYETTKYNNFTIAEHFRKQGAQIGENCHIGIRSLASEPYLIKFGNHVAIAKGLTLITHTSGWNFRDKIPDLQLFGKIIIDDNTYIGANVTILPNITIGKNCLISAGAVVTKDIPDNSIAAGVPAKVIGNMDDFFPKIKKIWEVQRPEGYIPDLKQNKNYSPAEFAKLRNKPENRELLKKHLIKLFWGN